MRITYFGHSSVKVEMGSQVVYFNPYAGPIEWYVRASLILVSSFDFDHCNIEKLKRAMIDSTHVLGTSDVARELFPSSVLRPGESRLFDDVEVVGMNVVSSRFEAGHRGKSDVDALGFVLLGEGKKLYLMGDSTFYPELSDLNPDVLFISVGGTYSSGAKEAASIASLIRPKVAIPIHWGGITGSRDDAELFKELASCPVCILEPGES